MTLPSTMFLVAGSITAMGGILLFGLAFGEVKEIIGGERVGHREAGSLDLMRFEQEAYLKYLKKRKEQTTQE